MWATGLRPCALAAVIPAHGPSRRTGCARRSTRPPCVPFPPGLRAVPHGGQVTRGAPPVRRACPSKPPRWTPQKRGRALRASLLPTAAALWWGPVAEDAAFGQSRPPVAATGLQGSGPNSPSGRGGRPLASHRLGTTPHGAAPCLLLATVAVPALIRAFASPHTPQRSPAEAGEHLCGGWAALVCARLRPAPRSSVSQQAPAKAPGPPGLRPCHRPCRCPSLWPLAGATAARTPFADLRPRSGGEPRRARVPFVPQGLAHALTDPNPP